MQTRIKLGDKVRDKYTGLTGWCHGLASYLTGCDQVLVDPRKLKDSDGEMVVGSWLDDSRIELVEELPTPEKTENGGPSAAESAGLRTT